MYTGEMDIRLLTGREPIVLDFDTYTDAQMMIGEKKVPRKLTATRMRLDTYARTD
jgi:hypothetical protein